MITAKDHREIQKPQKGPIEPERERMRDRILHVVDHVSDVAEAGTEVVGGIAERFARLSRVAVERGAHVLRPIAGIAGVIVGGTAGLLWETLGGMGRGWRKTTRKKKGDGRERQVA